MAGSCPKNRPSKYGFCSIFSNALAILLIFSDFPSNLYDSLANIAVLTKPEVTHPDKGFAIKLLLYFIALKRSFICSGVNCVSCNEEPS